MADDDDALHFADDDVSIKLEHAAADCWRVLIVDDDPDVHVATAFALRDVRILDRPLSLLNAHSAAEAHALLLREHDIAVILLDVVMEQDDAGLSLVRVIRDELGLSETRIVLRTGQPGYAPEIQAIRDYDINDYKTKSELTRTKLFTALTAAIRSFDQIRAINRNRRALDSLIVALNEMTPLGGVDVYAASAMRQLALILDISPESLLCFKDWAPDAQAPLAGAVVAASGRYAAEQGRSLDELADESLRSLICTCLLSAADLPDAERTACFYAGPRCRLVLVLPAEGVATTDRRRLLDVFCGSFVVGLDNARMFAHLHKQAYSDSLTTLPNRVGLIEQLDQRLASADCVRYTLALIDIDHFAEANDALGHAFGDQLLRAVAQRLGNALGHSCCLARISGDTFAALGVVEDLMPNTLLSLFAEPFMIEGQEMMLTATVGIALLSDIDGTGTDVVKGANIALRRAKTGNRGEYSFFTRDMADDIRERVRLLQALRHAIERQRLFLVYQPQLSLDTGNVCGVEALLRWRGDDGQLISPDRFIPIAEHSGLIVSIGEWVMRTACRQQVELAQQGFPQIRMAINVSVIQLRHPQFLRSLSEALSDSGADPRCIELEITESVAMLEADFISRMLDQIKALGISIALDDFGTGFSSLSYLRRLNIDRLKIDRSFISGITSGGRAQRIPELVMQLGQTLGLAVIAEGVEVAEQAAALSLIGCNEAQGYLYARPMESRMLLDWLRART
jgi:diguanylate cyclase